MSFVKNGIYKKLTGSSSEFDPKMILKVPGKKTTNLAYLYKHQSTEDLLESKNQKISETSRTNLSPGKHHHKHHHHHHKKYLHGESLASMEKKAIQDFLELSKSNPDISPQEDHPYEIEDTVRSFIIINERNLTHCREKNEESH